MDDNAGHSTVVVNNNNGPVEFHAFFDDNFEPTFVAALERHGDPEKAANSCVHSFASAYRSWWWLSRYRNPDRFVQRKLTGRSGAKWLTDIEASADAESLRSRVYVAATEVAGTRRWLGLGLVGATATAALLVAGVTSTGEPTPRDVVSATDEAPVVSTYPTPGGGSLGVGAEVPPKITTPPPTWIIDPDAFRESLQRETSE